MRRQRRLCFFRHRFSRWAWVKTDYNDGFEPEVRDDLQFRMCRRCGYQEIRELVDA